MGCFDTLVFPCPYCREENEEQSKAGACMMKTYRPGDSVQTDAAMQGRRVCQICGKRFTIVWKEQPQLVIRPLNAFEELDEEENS